MSDNAQVVTEAYGCFERGDIPSLLELLGDDVDWESPGVLPTSGSFRGHDGVGEFFTDVAGKWSELEVKPDDLVADGDHVVALGTARGKLAGGEEVSYPFSHAFRLDGGKVVHFREYVMVDDKLA